MDPVDSPAGSRKPNVASTILAQATVVYNATDGTPFYLNQCPDAILDRAVFADQPTVRSLLASAGKAPGFYQCVLHTNTLGSSGYLQANINRAAAKLKQNTGYDAHEVRALCEEHVSHCSMLYEANPENEASRTQTTSLLTTDLVNQSTVTYHLNLTSGLGLEAPSTTYDYYVSIKNCPASYESKISDVGFDRNYKAEVRNCFVNSRALDTPHLRPLLNFVTAPYDRQFSQDEICDRQLKVCQQEWDWNLQIPGQCRQVRPKCRAALKHLDAMMFRTDQNEQQCNNFALKSMRGIFHDYQTADIEGSILWELDMRFNLGMCKWSQYINALSDTTGCDPGSVIAIAGWLSFKACGIDMWGKQSNFGAVEGIGIGRGYECKANYNPLMDAPDPAFNGAMNRRHEFSDLSTSSNASNMEDFFWALTGHHTVRRQAGRQADKAGAQAGR